MTETVAPGTNRHLCPLECDWRYDELPFTMADAAGITPDPAAPDIRAALDSVVARAAIRRADVVENAFREHLAAAHGIRTVEELRAAIPAPTAPEGTVVYRRAEIGGGG